MSKNRQAITCNGRSAFYASIYEDIRQCAMDCGWAVALHGSLSSDMDIMAMPWTEEAEPFNELVNAISQLFDGNGLSEMYTITYNEKPHNRLVATIPIWADFHLDISTIDTREVLERIVERLEELFKYNSEQAEVYMDGDDSCMREKKEMYMDRANCYGVAIRTVKEVGGMND